MDSLHVGLKVQRHVECWRPKVGWERWARACNFVGLEKLAARIPRYLAWTDDSFNIVTTAGKNKVLDAAFKTGLTTPAWYVGLVDNASWTAYAAADVLSSHTGWIEGNPYTGNRKTWTAGTVSGGSVDNSGAVAAFAITATLTVRGCFLADAASGTSGTLFGEGDFANARSVISGDTLNVTITITD